MTAQEVLELIQRAKDERAGKLDLSDKNLTEIPPEIAQLTSLQELHLSFNQISEIPEALAQLTSLQYLDLSHNQISEIPEALAQLTSLQLLDLSNNQISEIPEALAQLTSLQHLRLSNNQISEIPEALAQLTSLQELNLTGNQIREIPEALAHLTSLQRLYLSSNQIREIPEALAQLTSLQHLRLNNNQIREIPEALVHLTSLQHLHLRNNQIREIPEALTHLVNLKRLVLKNNPITNVPPEIIRQGWGEEIWDDGNPQAIFSYLKNKATRPLNELKVLLVGEGDVGKTSLLKRLLHNTFNSEEPKTPGINIEKWQLSQKPDIRLNIWDFGGQKVMQTTHQFFLTKRSLYLLVLDNRKNEQQNRLEYWLKLIETYGGNSPVIIVGNCADENPPQVKIRTLRKKYPQITKLIATSCKTGVGIEQLVQEIASQIDAIPHIKDSLPNSWFEIKTQLETMQKSYDFISYEKYQEMCQTAEIKEASDQKSLVQFLHDLGIVLNYQDDPRLNETNVLNPEWVTDGVYDILNNHDLMVQKKGILSLPDLPNILKQPQRYPENKRRFLMDLMGKFELCFPLDGYSPDRYLITDLLPIDEPDVDSYENAPLHFQYRYDILPGSIISRFIVRNHQMIYKTMRWRSGVVLTMDLNKALVRADEEDNYISIKAQGSRASALLAIIRADFEKIHATIPNLAVQEKLVIRELQGEKPTGVEVPVDYLHLIELDRQGRVEEPLPGLRGKYNIRNILEGVESKTERARDLDIREERGRKSRENRPMSPKTPETPNLLKPSLALLLVLAVVACIVAVIAHFVPDSKHITSVLTIIFIFAFIVFVLLLLTGKINQTTFNQLFEVLSRFIPTFKGQEPKTNNDDTPQETPKSEQ
ncbi:MULTISPECIES: COR domain-containing protein [unclassified Microcystis]|jgi:internalin A|uniref:non-specific serine/threonine protein kinase n=1 Tax=Microcystis flos-aquae Mf_QC_C_20070823_S10D TaxID=2486236 RepID=A0A552KQK2_9CHRO|nr:MULTISPECIES: COR domain-containing protein [unclassified Microcystis]MCA2817972.1 leucine-rich repeat protein [Microcystis sp. M085S1]MCA2857440.1 leucine-rich repeat protein [Microcystis sp. M065S1]TRT92075.1 MAG: GTP-binding protein [Microcystis flos-aquae Ma_QC_C_20070823_S18D]TRV10232.1 MAG: GTP-binding protein [Microcystis flos-aquae Mf_QC_C_20070823_S10D]TRV20250.1 MAG: GTP-binding protein [Microcystis flos-aquae Mf_QC_C_20070823_S10]TRV37900.1 MAG: GTP-binding protein [Microcystis 